MARRIMRRFKLDEISAVDMPAQEHAVIMLTKRKSMTQLKPIFKHVGRHAFTKADFAYVGDEAKPTTWKLRLTATPGGKPTPAMVDKAVGDVSTWMDNNANGQAQPQKYHIPEDAIDDVLNRLREAWHMAYPNSANSDVPPVIQPDAVDPAAAMAAELDGEVDAGVGDGTDPAADDTAAADDAAAAGVDDAAAAADAANAADPAAAAVAAAAAAKPKPKVVPKKKPAPGKNPFVGKILKRYIDPMEGAKTFTDVLECYETDKKNSEIMDKAWPLISALDTSLRSILYDKDVEAAAKQNLMRSSVEGFLAGIKSAMPEIEEVLEKALAATEEEEKHMTVAKTAAGAGSSEIEKQVQALAGKVEALTKAAEDEKGKRIAAETSLAMEKTLNALTADERTYFATLKDESKQGEFLGMEKSARVDIAKRALASDETVIVEGVTISKSIVGEGMFAVLKAQSAKTSALEKRLQTSEEQRELVTLTKRAEDELGHLPGKIEEKVEFLKSIANMSATAQAYATTVFKSSKEVAKLGFERMGSRGTAKEMIIKGRQSDASSDFSKRVSELESSGVSGQEAMRKARKEDPEGFQAYQARQSN